ncbi:MAG TPA: BACON domain-containing carbohydrate-binding protein [Vicinamibacterales bacterium]|jgi:hypothetical protein|nr:BACON domain-containing carbohydrate-binding protein [Vicinamibacterales bacterium]
MHRSGAVVKRLILRTLLFVAFLPLIACGSTSVTEVTAPSTSSTRCQISLATTPTMPAGGGRVDVGLQAERECTWTAASEASWIQVSPASGQGEASISLTAASNPQAAVRSGTIVVSGTRYTISQAAAPCSFTISPAVATIGAAGGTTATDVTSLAGCAWTTSASVDWLRATPATSSGSDKVTITVAANTAASRSGVVTIAGVSFTVNQSAPAAAPGPSPTPEPGPAPEPPPSPECTYDIDPYFRTISQKGGDGSFKVITSPGCAWSAEPNVSWVHIKENATGTGTKDVKYHVDANRDDVGRIGTISAAGSTHTILQAAHD